MLHELIERGDWADRDGLWSTEWQGIFPCHILLSPTMRPLNKFIRVYLIQIKNYQGG